MPIVLPKIDDSDGTPLVNESGAVRESSCTLKLSPSQNVEADKTRVPFLLTLKERQALPQLKRHPASPLPTLSGGTFLRGKFFLTNLLLEFLITEWSLGSSDGVNNSRTQARALETRNRIVELHDHFVLKG